MKVEWRDARSGRVRLIEARLLRPLLEYHPVAVLGKMISELLKYNLGKKGEIKCQQ